MTIVLAALLSKYPMTLVPLLGVEEFSSCGLSLMEYSNGCKWVLSPNFLKYF